jgi:hypothetical protein
MVIFNSYVSLPEGNHGLHIKGGLIGVETCKTLLVCSQAVSKELGVAVATCQYRLMPLGHTWRQGTWGWRVEPMVLDIWYPLVI